MSNLSNPGRRVGLALWGSLLAAALGWVLSTYGERFGLVQSHHQLLAFLSILVLLLAGYLATHLVAYLKRKNHREQGLADKVYPQADAALSLPVPPSLLFSEFQSQIRDNYGWSWRRKVRLLLVVGEPEQVEAIAPGLNAQYPWLEGQGTVLFWGGSLQSEPDPALVEHWHRLCRWRGLDGVVWALDRAQSQDALALRAGARRLRQLARTLGWQLPLHLWQVCASAWSQEGRTTQAVGTLLSARASAGELDARLEGLLQPLREQGLEQMRRERLAHDFMLRLSRDLHTEGMARWRRALGPLWAIFARGLPLRGVWFSLPLPAQQGAVEQRHLWPADPAWAGLLGAEKPALRRLGWSLPRAAYTLLMGLAVAWGAGMLLSFASNRAQVSQVQQVLATLAQPGDADQQLLALNDLVHQLARLDGYVRDGAPWHRRFGLDRSQALLEVMWPRYQVAHQRLLGEPALAQLQGQLDALVALPAKSAERRRRARDSHGQLKAYLMLARPEKADGAFLAQILGAHTPAQADRSPALWQTLAPGLWQFHGEQLAAHPHWRSVAEARRVSQVRQVLLDELGQRNAEASVYRQVLDTAAAHYPALGLAQLVAGTEARALFSSAAQVPGVFTRQAWEGQVREAIDRVAEARREEIDWVLSDQPAELDRQLSPEQLKARLRERYFQDYASAWLDLLNSLRWRQAMSLDEAIEQLSLLSDARQSPLIALLNSLAYHGQAGARGQALADSLRQSAQKLLGEEAGEALKREELAAGGPLDATFGPWLALLGQAREGQGHDERLSLHGFLTRVTRVRLSLQQISQAADPQAMTQALAQSVFQGKGIDLSETRAYGSVVAASLGAQWAGVGQTLFVQPLEQAWQRLLQPSAAGLNRQWQEAIVSDWHAAFAARYPFALTDSDASLAMLGQMIRAESGRIEQFLQQQLAGVLRKDGRRWVVDPRHSQGLRFNPQFLAAINQLAELADVLFTDGGLGLAFELRAKPHRQVVDTTFVLDGRRLHYFNQQESWKRFTWPGNSDAPGARLSWTSVRSGERLYGDYPGIWGLIRLLEEAQATALDDGDSRYRVVIQAPDGLGLTWHLRSELGAGPLALLKLRGFELPRQIFLDKDAPQLAFAPEGRVE